jgi:hypothetical protein
MAKKKTTTRPAAPEHQQRMAAYNAMTVAMQKQADDIAVFVTRESVGVLKTRWKIGARIAKILKQESEYGSNAVEQLAQYLNVSADLLYKYRNAATAFSEAEVTALAERRMADGRHIEFTHLMCLSRVTKASERAELVERIFDQSMSSGDLATTVATQYDTNHHGKGGRKPASPKSAMAGVQQLNKQTQTLIGRFPVWQEVVFDKIDEIEPENINDLLQSGLTEAEQRLSDLSLEADQARERVKTNRERVERVLALRADTKAEDDKDAEDRLEGATDGRIGTSSRKRKKTKRSAR